jgi:hypothetical protein
LRGCARNLGALFMEDKYRSKEYWF